MPKYKCSIQVSQAHSFVCLEIRVWRSFNPAQPERGEYRRLSSAPGLSRADAEEFARDLEAIQLVVPSGG